MTEFLDPLVISVFSHLQQSPQPRVGVAVLDAPTPPSSRGGSLHLPMSSLPHLVLPCLHRYLWANVHLTYIDNINCQEETNSVTSLESTITMMSEQHEDVGGGRSKEVGRSRRKSMK